MRKLPMLCCSRREDMVASPVLAVTGVDAFTLRILLLLAVWGMTVAEPSLVVAM